MRRALACATLVAAVAGCSWTVDYGPAADNSGVGYWDRVNADGSHTVGVNLTEFDSPELAFAWWDRRATELCGAAPARRLMHSAFRPTERYDQYGGRPGWHRLEGIAYCTDRPDAKAAETEVADLAGPS